MADSACGLFTGWGRLYCGTCTPTGYISKDISGTLKKGVFDSSGDYRESSSGSNVIDVTKLKCPHGDSWRVSDASYQYPPVGGGMTRVQTEGGKALYVPNCYLMGNDEVEFRDEVLEEYGSECRTIEGYMVVDDLSVKYEVKHFFEVRNYTSEADRWMLRTVSSEKGFVGEIVEGKIMEVEGFESPDKISITLNADGLNEINYYYRRKSYNLNLQAGTGIEKVTGGGSYLYEQEVTISAAWQVSAAFCRKKARFVRRG